jgi:hypothetical protein
MRAVFAVAGIAGLAGVAIACESLDGLTSNGGGGGDNAGVPDASTTDGAVGASDAGGSRFCASLSPPADFCDDFDGLDPLQMNWDVHTQKAAIEKNGGNLLISTDAISGSDTSLASVVHNMARLATITLSFRMLVETGTFYRTLAGIHIVDGDRWYSAELNVSSQDELEFQEYAMPGFGGNQSFSAKTPFTADYDGKWTQIRMEATFGGAPHARVWVGDSASPSIDQALTPTIAGSQMYFVLGATYVAPVGIAGAIRYDDVVARLQ